MEIDLSSHVSDDIDFYSDSKLSDFAYGDNVILVFGESIKLQVFRDRLNDSEGVCMRFAPSKCKILLKDWIG